MVKTKTDYLFKFRRCSQMDTLEKVFDHMKNEVPDSDLAAFHGAYDHRKAELTMKKNFDKIPATAWKYVK